MALLSCARKNRTMLWQRRSSHRRGLLRHSAPAAGAGSTRRTPAVAMQAAASSIPHGTRSLSASSTAAIHTVDPRATSSSTSTSASTLASATANSDPADASPARSSGSWRAMLLTFFAMLQPDHLQEHSSKGDTNVNALRVRSVPPHVSEVVGTDGGDQDEDHPGDERRRRSVDAASTPVRFWRYDMESYAANRHNEDRSQYVLDTLEWPSTPSTPTSPTTPPIGASASTCPSTAPSTPIFFCGCYDGHGGQQAVEFVRRNLYSNIKRHLLLAAESSASPSATATTVPSPMEGHHVKDAIMAGFLDTDLEFQRESCQQFDNGHWAACSVGACAVVALLIDTKLYVASCGDCRAIMGVRQRDGSLRVEQVTWDHSANDKREQERLRRLHPEDYDIVRAIGGPNFYVKGRLQPTRSLGDTYMKVQAVNRAPMPRGLRVRGSFERPYITAVPDVFEIDLEEEEHGEDLAEEEEQGERGSGRMGGQPEFLVLGSDGLYGELSNREIASLVDRYRTQGVKNVGLAVRRVALERVARSYGFASARELEAIAPGERRSYHDDITVDVLHFTAPSGCHESQSEDDQGKSEGSGQGAAASPVAAESA